METQCTHHGDNCSGYGCSGKADSRGFSICGATYLGWNCTLRLSNHPRLHRDENTLLAPHLYATWPIGQALKAILNSKIDMQPE